MGTEWIAHRESGDGSINEGGGGGAWGLPVVAAAMKGFVHCIAPRTPLPSPSGLCRLVESDALPVLDPRRLHGYGLAEPDAAAEAMADAVEGGRCC
jgi:hypothetical protein